MKKILLFLLIAYSNLLSAQNGWKCGTPPPFMPMSGFAVQENALQERTDPTTLYIPLTIHIVGDDYGIGYYPLSSLLDDLCELDADFKPYGIQFFFQGLPRYLNSSEFYYMNRDTFYYTDTMFNFVSSHNIPNTLNIYIIADHSPGLTTFRDRDYDNSTYPPTISHPQNHGIFLGKNLLHGYKHILTHEVGHYLGLWHTFLGWEGLNYLTMQDHVPDTLFWAEYDPYLDTIYYDVPYPVERADGSNCSFAGDLICDTPPDYLSIGFQCNEYGESNIVQYDPQGNPFRSDGTNYMSYSNDECENRFSNQQVAMMRAVINGPRKYLLYHQVPSVPIQANEISFLYPTENFAVAIDDSVALEWEPVSGADYYVVEFGRKLGATHYIPLFRDALTDTSYFKVAVKPNLNYYCKVTAINNYKPCHPLADTLLFSTSPITATHEQVISDQLVMYPNPATEKLYWNLPIERTLGPNMEIQIFDALGNRARQLLADGKSSIDIADLSTGIYLVMLTGPFDIYSGKFVKK